MSQGTVTMTEPTIQGFALSPQQQHLWRLCSADGARPYRAEAAIRVAGDVDAELLAAALREVVARHEILRTRFECLPGMKIPLQVVGEAGVAWGGERRIAALPGERELDAIFAELAGSAEDDAARPLRALLLRPEEGRALLCLSMPALVADGGTLRHLVGEIAAAYGGPSGGPEPADEPLQFADLAAWLNELLDSEDMAEERQVWRPEEILPALAARLPGERDGGAFAPEVVALSFDRGALASGEAGPAAFLLACWQILLWRHLEEPELVVSVLSPGRGFEELEGALGPLARYVPVRVRLRGNRRFRQLARRAGRDLQRADAASGAFSWERLSGDGAETPPAAVFAFDGGDDFKAEASAAAGVRFSLARGRVHGDRFSLKLVCAALGDGRAEIHYDASRLDDAAAEALARRFEALVRRAVAGEDRPIGELDVVTGAERRHLLFELNRTRVDLGAEDRLHRLVRAQAERTPDKTAVRSGEESGGGGESLTYAELMARSAELAHRLRRLGAGPEERIAILAERSPEMVVGLLGILAAGGAYVPLDPDHPRERLAAILADTTPRLLLAERRLAGLVPAAVGATSVWLGEGAAAEAPEELPPGPVDGKNLAYVIHTSGSTGRPKGVMVSHRAIANRLLWMQREFPLSASDRVLQKTPLSFDASIWEIFCPLLAGAELVMARPGGHADSAYLAREVGASEITVLQLVPSLLHPFLDAPGVEDCTSLERMFCGGEELTTALAERFGRRLGARLHNLYGPTEAAIDATFWVCRPGPSEGGRGVPIGRPLANVEVHVLNPHLLLAPPEVPGELMIGGAGLARGYRGRPGETAARFLPNPWSEVPGERLYRTGDLVCRRPGGEIEYLGRIDRQVKIRGARIELSEIEAVLGEHPAVAQALAVALPEEAAGEGALLTAYVVPREGGIDLAELRLHTSERLPSFMVPQAVVTLRSLPRLPNGKIDWKALPEPEAEALAGDRVEPRTPIEQVLAGAWAEVLGIDPPGAGDNFFDLGGHSLRATQLVTRLRQLLQVELAVRDLFQWPTIALLAERVEEVRRRAAGLEAPPVVPVARDRPLPLSFAQQRLWFLYRMQPQSSYYNIPVVLEFRGELDVGVLRGTLGVVVRRHESLRTTFYEDAGGEPRQRIGPPSVPPLPVVDLSALPKAVAAAEADRQIRAEVARPFDLGTGPIFRALLFRRGAGDHLGVLNQHHITADGWSTAVLVREVAAAYRALLAGERPLLPELEIQYADFASWQREWLRGEVLEAHIAYWREQLRGAPPLLELPSDRPRPAVRTHRGANAFRQLAAGLDNRLAALARRSGVTLFMALAAAVQALLRSICRRDDVVIGTDVANRNRGETEGLIGFFINQLALRTDLSGDPTWAELLERVREVSLGAYAHEDLPFDKLVEILNPERSRSYSPLFQVKVNLLNVPTPELELPGLELRPLNVARDTAQFDLILNFVPGPEFLGVSADYSTELFDGKTVERLLEQLEAVLTLAVERPEIRLSELDAELRQAEEARQRAEREAGRQARGRALSRRSRRRARRVTPGGEHANS